MVKSKSGLAAECFVPLFSRKVILFCNNLSVPADVSIYSLAWGPKSEQIVHTCGKQLVIRSIKANVQPVTVRFFTNNVTPL